MARVNSKGTSTAKKRTSAAANRQPVDRRPAKQRRTAKRKTVERKLIVEPIPEFGRYISGELPAIGDIIECVSQPDTSGKKYYRRRLRIGVWCIVKSIDKSGMSLSTLFNHLLPIHFFRLIVPVRGEVRLGRRHSKKIRDC